MTHGGRVYLLLSPIALRLSRLTSGNRRNPQAARSAKAKRSAVRAARGWRVRADVRSPQRLPTSPHFTVAQQPSEYSLSLVFPRDPDGKTAPRANPASESVDTPATRLKRHVESRFSPSCLDGQRLRTDSVRPPPSGHHHLATSGKNVIQNFKELGRATGALPAKLKKNSRCDRRGVGKDCRAIVDAGDAFRHR